MTTQTRQPTRRLFNADEYYAMAEAGILTEDEHLELIQGRILLRYEAKPRLFDVDEYYAMAEAGIFAHDERVELVNGEIIAMPTPGNPHAYSVDELTESFIIDLRGRVRVRCQNTVRLDNFREVLPDVALLRLRDDLYFSGPPHPEDVFLLVEVSDSTLRYDLNTKLPLYAEAGIPETWIVNIPERVVEVYTEPVDGVYRRRRVFGQDESVSPTAFPEVSLPVSRIVPA